MQNDFLRTKIIRFVGKLISLNTAKKEYLSETFDLEGGKKKKDYITLPFKQLALKMDSSEEYFGMITVFQLCILTHGFFLEEASFPSFVRA